MHFSIQNPHHKFVIHKPKAPARRHAEVSAKFFEIPRSITKQDEATKKEDTPSRAKHRETPKVQPGSYFRDLAQTISDHFPKAVLGTRK